MKLELFCKSLYGTADKLKCGKRDPKNRGITLKTCAACKPEITIIKVADEKDTNE